MSKPDGINGIPVRIKTSKNAMETIYFATFRKCPVLKDLAKKFNKLSIELEKAIKRNNYYDRQMYMIEDKLKPDQFEKQLDERSKLAESHREKLDELTEQCIEFQRDYCIKALAGAGYTKDLTEEFAEYIPSNRFPEVLEATRTGAMTVIDFFTETNPQKENSPTTSLKKGTTGA